MNDAYAPTVSQSDYFFGVKHREYRKQRLAVRLKVKKSRASIPSANRADNERLEATFRRYLSRWAKRRGYIIGNDVRVWEHTEYLEQQRYFCGVCWAIVRDPWSEKVTPSQIDSLARAIFVLMWPRLDD